MPPLRRRCSYYQGPALSVSVVLYLFRVGGEYWHFIEERRVVSSKME